MVKKLKAATWEFIRLIQKIIITISLFLIYIFGLGFTIAILLFTNRKILSGFSKAKDTFWIEAEGYESEIEKCLRES